MGILQLEQSSAELLPPLDNGFAASFLPNLNRRRPEKNTNNLFDSLVLAELTDLISLQGKQETRFYTESTILWGVATSEAGTRLLSVGEQYNSRHIVRSAEYFLMRASFRALEWPGGTHGTIDDDLFDLTHVWEELDYVIRTEESWTKIGRSLRDLKIAGRSVETVLKDVIKLRFVGGIVSEVDFSNNEMELLLPGIGQLSSNKHYLDEAVEELEQQTAEFLQELTERVDLLARWAATADAILESLEKKQGKLGKGHPDLARDLGLGRWGLERSISHRADLEEWLSSLPSLDAVSLALEAGNLARETLDSNLTEEGRKGVLVKLWALQLKEQIIEFWRRSESAGNIDSDWKILALVMEMRLIDTATSHSVEKAQRILRQAREWTDCAPATSVGFRLLGFAHVAYWAWRRLGGVKVLGKVWSKGENPNGDLLEELVQESFDAAARATEVLHEPSLSRTFAINHCVYIGHFAGIEEDRTASFFTQLSVQFRENESHYRFADTLALPKTLAVGALVEKFGLQRLTQDPSLSKELDFAARTIQHVVSLLESTQPWYGDTEVEEHYEWATYHDSKFHLARL